jgi:hypothetical protein
MQAILRYGPHVVGEVTEPFCSDDTWFGGFTLVAYPAVSAIPARLCEFVEFSRSWHARIKSGLEPEGSEFDRFKDLLSSGLWRVELPNGDAQEIAEAPVFVEDEVSWRAVSSG